MLSTTTTKPASSRTRARARVLLPGLSLALTLASMAAMAAVAPSSSSSPMLVETAHAASGLHYHRGYSVQGAWLCYGYASGVYHCTLHWHRTKSGQLVSDNPSWVPNVGGSTKQSDGGGQDGSGPGGTTSGTVTSGQPCHSVVSWPKTISQWTVPLGCYSKIYFPNPHNYPSRPGYGWCNWWPEVLHPKMSGSSALHMPSHSTPKPGAVIFFAPHVQGAGPAGHYAQVVAVAPGGKWVLITEMNFAWRGAGFKKVDYRFIHVGAGVSFRYL